MQPPALYKRGEIAIFRARSAFRPATLRPSGKYRKPRSCRMRRAPRRRRSANKPCPAAGWRSAVNGDHRADQWLGAAFANLVPAQDSAPRQSRRLRLLAASSLRDHRGSAMAPAGVARIPLPSRARTPRPHSPPGLDLPEAQLIILQGPSVAIDSFAETPVRPIAPRPPGSPAISANAASSASSSAASPPISASAGRRSTPAPRDLKRSSSRTCPRRRPAMPARWRDPGPRCNRPG